MFMCILQSLLFNTQILCETSGCRWEKNSSVMPTTSYPCFDTTTVHLSSPLLHVTGGCWEQYRSTDCLGGWTAIREWGEAKLAAADLQVSVPALCLTCLVWRTHPLPFPRGKIFPPYFFLLWLSHSSYLFSSFLNKSGFPTLSHCDILLLAQTRKLREGMGAPPLNSKQLKWHSRLLEV